jgi:two-component system phosphate regulon response regulator PhoB
VKSQQVADKVLIVDDEKDVVDLLAFNLKNAGFQTAAAYHGDEVVGRVKRDPPAVILLDIMLPGSDGIEICKKLKHDPSTSAIPVIMLTAKGDEVDRVLGFELGADDYITKPFSPREVVLRVKSILKRIRGEEKHQDFLTAGAIKIDISRHSVSVGDAPVELTATEFKLLALLIKRRGRVQSRDRLLNDVWDYEASIDTRTVDTHVRRLREKLGAASDMIETVRGVGYRFTETD